MSEKVRLRFFHSLRNESFLRLSNQALRCPKIEEKSRSAIRREEDLTDQRNFRNYRTLARQHRAVKQSFLESRREVFASIAAVPLWLLAFLLVLHWLFVSFLLGCFRLKQQWRLPFLCLTHSSQQFLALFLVLQQLVIYDYRVLFLRHQHSPTLNAQLEDEANSVHFSPSTFVSGSDSPPSSLQDMSGPSDSPLSSSPGSLVTK